MNPGSIMTSSHPEGVGVRSLRITLVTNRRTAVVLISGWEYDQCLYENPHQSDLEASMRVPTPIP